MVSGTADKLESLMSATAYAEEGDFIAARRFTDGRRKRKRKKARRLSRKWEDLMTTVAFAEEGAFSATEKTGSGGNKGPSSVRKGRARRNAVDHALLPAKA